MKRQCGKAADACMFYIGFTIDQLMDELESLEETLNESIQESVGARTGKGTSKKKPVFEDEEDDVRYKELNLLWYQCLFFHLLICLLTL